MEDNTLETGNNKERNGLDGEMNQRRYRKWGTSVGGVVLSDDVVERNEQKKKRKDDKVFFC